MVRHGPDARTKAAGRQLSSTAHNGTKIGKILRKLKKSEQTEKIVVLHNLLETVNMAKNIYTKQVYFPLKIFNITGIALRPQQHGHDRPCYLFDDIYPLLLHFSSLQHSFSLLPI